MMLIFVGPDQLSISLSPDGKSAHRQKTSEGSIVLLMMGGGLEQGGNGKIVLNVCVYIRRTRSVLRSLRVSLDIMSQDRHEQLTCPHPGNSHTILRLCTFDDNIRRVPLTPKFCHQQSQNPLWAYFLYLHCWHNRKHTGIKVYPNTGKRVPRQACKSLRSSTSVRGGICLESLQIGTRLGFVSCHLNVEIQANVNMA